MDPNSGINRMTMPRISEEPDVPCEDNRTFQDGRLEPAGISSQVRHYSGISTTTPIQGERILQSGVNVDRPILEAPLAGASTHYAESSYIPSSTSTGLQQGIPQTGISQVVHQGEAITRKDADAVIKHLPHGEILQSSIPQQNLQGAIPTQYATTTSSGHLQGHIISSHTLPSQPFQNVQGQTFQGQHIQQIPQGSTIPVTTTSVIHQPGEIIRETTTTTTTVGPVPGAGAIVDTNIANLSEINAAESQFMRDSGRLHGTESPSHSKWEAQQFELSTMRHESHQAFENWEANRNRFVNDRLNIMNDLLAGMDRTIDWLDVGVSKVILFFKERESQELEYSKRVKHGLTQVGDHFQSSEHPEVLSNFSRGLKENDAFHAQEKRNCEIMGMFIKKDIIDWILTPCEKNYKEQAHALRNPLHAYKKKLDHLASKRHRAYSKYFKTYDHIQKTGKPPKSEDSVFKRQLKYSLAAREELRMLRLYDEQGLSVIQEFAKLSSLRLQEVQRAYTLYLQKYRELYQNTATAPEPIMSLIETSQGPESVPNLFTVKNLLQPHNYDFVRQTLGMPANVPYDALTPFLVNFPDSVDPTRTSFVLREWEAVKQGGILKKPKACSVIATTNNNLLIIEKKHEEQELGKVKEPMQLRFTKVEDVTATEDGTVLKVVERAPGTIFQHTTRTKLKFETQDEANQFMQFINTQTSGDV